MPTSVEEILNADAGEPAVKSEPVKEPQEAAEKPEEGTGDADKVESEDPPQEETKSSEDAPQSTEEAPKDEPPSSKDTDAPLDDITQRIAELEKEAKGKTAALEAERKKRQEAEAKLTQQEVRPDQFDDPEGARKFDEAQLENRLFNERANTSELIARAGPNADFVDEALGMFQEKAETNQALAAEMRQSPDPYGFIIQWARKEKMYSEIGDPDAWKTKQLADIEARFKADIEALQEQQQDTAKRDALPESLANEGSVGSTRTAPPNVPTSVSQILPD